MSFLIHCELEREKTLDLFLPLVEILYRNLWMNDLTLLQRRSLSYRNQFVDLLCKSVNWLLYDRNLRHERVKSIKASFTEKKSCTLYLRNHSFSTYARFSENNFFFSYPLISPNVNFPKDFVCELNA